MKWTKPLILLIILVTLFTVARVYNLGDKPGELKEWISGQGALAPFLFGLLYVVATVAAIPGSALTIAAGALFGSVIGIVVVIFSATAGAALCFLIARYFARDSLAAIMAKNESFKKLDALTEKNGEIIVAITRLVPIFPFNLLNYGFGLTNVSFKTYVIWSFFCMLPGTVLYVVGTDAITTAIENGKPPWILIGVVIFIIALLSFLVKKAKARLKE